MDCLAMIALVIVFCHFAEPVECKIVRLVPESQTQIGCVIEGQERAALWLDDHPAWDLVRGICEQNIAPQKPT